MAHLVDEPTDADSNSKGDFDDRGVGPDNDLVERIDEYVSPSPTMSKALDSSGSNYPPGFRPFIGESYEHYINQVEDMPIQASSMAPATSTEFSAPPTAVLTTVAVSQVTTDGYTTVVYKRTRRRISEKRKQ